MCVGKGENIYPFVFRFKSRVDPDRVEGPYLISSSTDVLLG